MIFPGAEEKRGSVKAASQLRHSEAPRTFEPSHQKTRETNIILMATIGIFG